MTDSIERQLRAGDVAAAQISAAAPPLSAVQPCRQGSWCEIRLAGADGVTIGGETYELANGAARPVRGKTRADGSTRVEGLAEGEWTLSFPGLDEEAWGPVGATTPPAAPRAAATTIEVVQGDCVHTLAVAHGFFAGTVMALDANRALAADLRAEGILYPGDILALPTLRVRKVPVVLERLNEFERRGVPLFVRIRVEGDPDDPVKYLMEIDGVAEGGTLAAYDVAEVAVDQGAAKGTLQLKGGQAFAVHVGHLDPVTTESGLKSRLVHLSYLLPQSQDESQGIDAARALAAALRLFQVNHDLEATGEADGATRDMLVSVHGC
ncbi:hypothetical protein HH212_18620 [Massilia forsythiae]|uniref:Peptidoglycan-binding protein n=1 Tax=Massilia forsythiae TaxID=2728020 RepID=A0A7Z2VYH8_9BURK|nr:peptidoglycan-binding protein [Massilia forsythiae]QJE01793.1 hypothetical protein HH212_18620 [Massilia forsythiae]